MFSKVAARVDIRVAERNVRLSVPGIKQHPSTTIPQQRQQRRQKRCRLHIVRVRLWSAGGAGRHFPRRKSPGAGKKR